MNNYDDIINLPRPVSKKHKQMSLINRAAQFAPFAALTGFDEVIDETGRLTDKRIELDEYEISDINNLLLYLCENKEIIASFTYFVSDLKKSGGSYNNVIASIAKNDIDNHRIILSDNTIIDIEDLIKVDLL